MRLRALLLVVGVALGCHREPPDALDLTVGRVMIPAFALLFVAEDRSLFEEEGVRPSFVTFEAGRDALASAVDGGVDVATVYTTPLVLQAFRGNDIVAVTTLHRAEGLTGLVAREGAEIRDLAALAGRSVGVTRGTSAELVLDVLLAESGIPRSQIRVIFGTQIELVRKLKAGEVDAAVLWPPHIFVTPRDPAIFTSDSYIEMSTLTGRRDRVEAKVEALTRFLRALIRSQEIARRSPDVLRDSLRRRFPALPDRDLGVILERTRFEVGLSNLLLTTLRQEAGWLERQGMPRHAGVRVDRVLAPELLTVIDPEWVTLLNDPLQSPGRHP